MKKDTKKAIGDDGITAHPFMPASAPEVREALLRGAGVEQLADLYSSVPPEDLWDGTTSHAISAQSKTEREVARAIGDRLRDDRASRMLCFRGGGCAPHYVPAVCHEIAGRQEFLTVYAGSTHTNHGLFQAQFEFQSLLAEVLDMGLVGTTLYDWGWAAARGVKLGLTVTGRATALVAGHVAPARMEQIVTLCRAEHIEELSIDTETGELDVSALRDRLKAGDVGAVYLEMPTYLGGVDAGVRDAFEACREAGAVSVAGVDPMSLGLLEPPGALGADLACGTLQGLGIPMYAGGGEAGFLACRDNFKFREAFPDLLVAALDTGDPDSPAYYWVNFEDVHYGLREKSPDFTGTTQTLWAVVAAGYLALAGRDGLRSVGEAIIARGEYLRAQLGDLAGVSVRDVGGPSFKEHVVVLPDDAPVDRVNKFLSDAGVIGGIDLRGDFGWLGNAMLVCVTENHTYADIDVLVSGLRDALTSGQVTTNEENR